MASDEELMRIWKNYDGNMPKEAYGAFVRDLGEGYYEHILGIIRDKEAPRGVLFAADGALEFYQEKFQHAKDEQTEVCYLPCLTS